MNTQASFKDMIPYISLARSVCWKLFGPPASTREAADLYNKIGDVAEILFSKKTYLGLYITVLDEETTEQIETVLSFKETNVELAHRQDLINLLYKNFVKL